MSLIDYQVPLNFSYSKKESRLEEKICNLGKKIFRYISQHHYTIAVMIWSYLIIEVATFNSMSTASPTSYDLQDCEYKICDYWNNSTRFQSYSPINLEGRCNSSHSNYNPFSSFNECKKNLCRYTNMIGKNLSECSIYVLGSNKFTELWNKFCPKEKFNKLRKNRRTKFLERCLERLCEYYKNKPKKQLFFCSSIIFNKGLKNFSNEIKTWKSTETDESGLISESVLSIASSTIGTLSGLVSIIASGIGCYAARITMTSVTEAIPNVEQGLRMVIDGGVNNILDVTEAAFERRLSVVQTARQSLFRDIKSINEISEIAEDSDEYFFSFQEDPVVDTALEGTHPINGFSEITGNPFDQMIPIDIEGFDQKNEDEIKILLPFKTQQMNTPSSIIKRITQAYTQSFPIVKPTLSTAEKIYNRLARLLNQG